jgi:hypothetical protein
VTVLYFGPYEILEIIISLTMQINMFYAGSSVGYTLDPFVILLTINKEAQGFGYSVQPAREGFTGYI